MEKMLAFSKNISPGRKRASPPQRPFYATLSPEQRQIFDKDFKFEHSRPFWQALEEMIV